MRHIFGNAFAETLPTEYKEVFERKLALDNCRRTFVINIICMCFTLPLFLLDFIRWRSGSLFDSSMNMALSGTHLMVALQVIPFLMIYRNFSDIKTGRFNYGKSATRLTLILLIAALMPMAAISLVKRDSVAIFAIYIGVSNIVVLLSHRDRILLNGISILAFIGLIIGVQQGRSEVLAMNIFECLALVVPNFIFATYQYNLTVRQFRNARLLESQKRAIEAEKQRSEALLHNILPIEIANELRQKGFVVPRYYESATILFTDFKGFSAICRTLGPDELVADLSHCFGAFDRIVAAHGVERVKTIGDAYMCVSGVPNPVSNHAMRMLAVAREMRAFLQHWKTEREAQHRPVFEARIGLHSGPIVAGVVGQTRFAFDIWGDAVNVAARMEQACEPGKINISQATLDLLDGQVPCTPRGSLPVKHLGAVDMFYVNES